MKKLLFPILLVVFGLSSCDSLSKLTQFEKSFSTTVNIPAAATILPFPISAGSPEIKTDISQYLSDNKIDTALIEKVSLKKLEMIITAPIADSCNFNFLSEVEVSIYTADSTLVTKIASLRNVPANKTIELNVEPADLKKIILKEAFKLGFKITCKQAIKSDYTVDVKPTFLLDVNVLGL